MFNRSEAEDDSYSVNYDGVTIVDANKLFAMPEVQDTMRFIAQVFQDQQES